MIKSNHEVNRRKSPHMFYQNEAKLSFYKNQLTDLHCKSINWFLKDMSIDHKLFKKQTAL